MDYIGWLLRCRLGLVGHLGLHVEAEYHDVAVLEHVFLALDVHFAFLFHCRLATVGNILESYLQMKL